LAGWAFEELLLLPLRLATEEDASVSWLGGRKSTPPGASSRSLVSEFVSEEYGKGG
jgi:hypothetical protein